MIAASPQALGRLVQTQLAANEVVMRRLGLMWLAPYAPSTHSEMSRMLIEKQLAVAEAAMAFSWTLAGEAWKLWAGAAFGRLSQHSLHSSLSTSMRKAALPISRRVKANRRRLRS
jgi:hypothetical protein